MEFNSHTTIAEEPGAVDGAMRRESYHTPELTDLGGIHFVIASQTCVGTDGTLACSMS